VGRVAEETERVDLAKAQPMFGEPLEDECAEQGADGNEHDRVRELAVILEEQQRIRGRANQYVEVRRHPGQATQPRGGPEFFPAGDGFG